MSIRYSPLLWIGWLCVATGGAWGFCCICPGSKNLFVYVVSLLCSNVSHCLQRLSSGRSAWRRWVRKAARCLPRKLLQAVCGHKEQRWQTSVLSFPTKRQPTLARTLRRRRFGRGLACHSKRLQRVKATWLHCGLRTKHVQTCWRTYWRRGGDPRTARV